MLISELPDDLILEILSRVPVKSLLRFKSVSKSWGSLISSPFFATLHRRASKNRCLISSPEYIALLGCDRSTYNYRCSPLYRSLINRFPVYMNGFHVVGSSNGLICVCSRMGEHLCVWNPATRESIEILPDLKHKKDDYRRFVTRLGFGYDESGDDYKIVMATSGYLDWNVVDPVINIYSSKTGTWKCLADKEGLHLRPYHSQRSGTLVNGALHWQLAVVKLGLQEAKILTFDLAEETFRVFLPPPVVSDIQIGILNEMLCFSDICYNFGQGTFDHCIWAMKEYGVETSWTKLFTIGSFGYPKPTSHLYQCMPLCSTECGEIFYIGLGLHMCLVLFNPEKEILPLDCSYASEATVYVETLVSPNISRAKEKKYDSDEEGSSRNTVLLLESTFRNPLDDFDCEYKNEDNEGEDEHTRAVCFRAVCFNVLFVYLVYLLVLV